MWLASDRNALTAAEPVRSFLLFALVPALHQHIALIQKQLHARPTHAFCTKRTGDKLIQSLAGCLSGNFERAIDCRTSFSHVRPRLSLSARCAHAAPGRRPAPWQWPPAAARRLFHSISRRGLADPATTR